MEIKAVFCDIDGTLLDDEHRLSRQNREAVQGLVGSGIPFIPVSARLPFGVQMVLEELNIAAPMVCYSGGLALSETGEVICSHTLPPSLARQVWQQIRKTFPAVSVCGYAGERWLVEDPADPWMIEEGLAIPVSPETGSIPALLNQVEALHKLLCMGPAEEIERLIQTLSPLYPALSLRRSNAEHLEVMPQGVTKSGALALLCERLGISPQQSIAFGDNENDLDMLKAAGCGIAMGNATLPVREQADLVAPSNAESGVAQMLQRLGLSAGRIGESL